MSSARLIVVRHGESEGNAAGILQGRVDYGLTERGRLQAAATAEILRGAAFVRVFTSPLRRARDTAAPIAAALGIAVEVEPRLIEYDYGEASGLNAAGLRERFPEILAARAAGRRPPFPGEEDRAAFHLRVDSVLDDLLSHDGAVIAVAHGGVAGALCARAVGLDPAIRGAFAVENCSVSEIVRDRSGNLVLRRQNHTAHLAHLV